MSLDPVSTIFTGSAAVAPSIPLHCKSCTSELPPPIKSCPKCRNTPYCPHSCQMVGWKAQEAIYGEVAPTPPPPHIHSACAQKTTSSPIQEATTPVRWHISYPGSPAFLNAHVTMFSLIHFLLTNYASRTRFPSLLRLSITVKAGVTVYLQTLFNSWIVWKL